VCVCVFGFMETMPCVIKLKSRGAENDIQGHLGGRETIKV